MTNRWQAAQRAALKPFGLTHVQFVLLASLTWLDAEGPVTRRQLADHAATGPMMTSQVLRALANPAVVAVEACDHDVFAALSPGVAAFTRALATLEG